MKNNHTQDILDISSCHKVLEEYYIYLSVLKRYSKSTINTYYETINQLFYFLWKQKVKNIKNIDKKILYDFLELTKTSSISNRTMNLHIASINNFLCFLSQRYNVFGLPKLKNLKFPDKLVDMIDEDEMLRLLKNNDPRNKKESTWINYRNYALAVFAYSTGARIGEIVNILMVDIADFWVRIEKTKNKETRVVPLNKHAMDVLYLYIERCPYCTSKILWYSIKGKKLTANTATKAITNTFGYSAHYFRHAFATHLVHNGCDLMTVKEFLGHSSIVTTSIYTHVKPKHLLKTVSKFHPLS